MTAGDTHIIKSGEANFIKTGRNIHGNAPLIKAAQNPKELTRIHQEIQIQNLNIVI